MSDEILRIVVRAAGRSAVMLLSVVGIVFLLGNMTAWMNGEDIVIPAQSRPAIVVALASWLALAAVLVGVEWRHVSKDADLSVKAVRRDGD